MTTDPDALELVRRIHQRADDLEEWLGIAESITDVDNDKADIEIMREAADRITSLTAESRDYRLQCGGMELEIADLKAELARLTTPAEARREVAARCRAMIETYAPFHTAELSKLLKDAAKALEGK